MTQKNKWETFFDSHAPVYMQNVFTRDTDREVAFLIEELSLPPGSTILDIGCGTGRHAVGLAKNGFNMTGVDISSGMLGEAAKAADEAGVEITLIHGDATRFVSDQQFDAAICLCEGAFGLLADDDDPFEHELTILRNIHAALNPGAPFILTALSGSKKLRSCKKTDIEQGKFDPVTLVETFSMEYDTPDGKKSVVVYERGFMPSELRLMMRQTGFDVAHIWGGTAGNWGRRQLDLDEYEIMVVARKV